jgi:hypothetical protein
MELLLNSFNIWARVVERIESPSVAATLPASAGKQRRKKFLITDDVWISAA